MAIILSTVHCPLFYFIFSSLNLNSLLYCVPIKQDSQCEYQRLIYIYVPFSFLEVSNTVIAKNAVSPAIDSNNARDFTTLEFELILDVDGVEFGAS